MYVCLIGILSAIIGGVLLFWAIKADIPVSSAVEKITVILLILAMLVGGIWAGRALSANSVQSNFSDEYNQLKLYQYTVESSTNEYLRFDYYNRVQEWNSKYDTYTKLESNPWINWFVFEPMKYCDRIEFALNGDPIND